MEQKFVTLPREVAEQAVASIEMLNAGKWTQVTALAATPRASLDQPQNHVPDAGNMVLAGWKLVPVEPTVEMMDAGGAATRRCYQHLNKGEVMCSYVYRHMLDAAPQPPTTEQSSVVERPQGERHPGVLMPSRSLVDQVIREIARYCNTGEMDDAESLLASLQLSLDPDQQPPTTEDCSVVEPPKGEQEPVVWQYRMRPDWGSQKDCWGPWQDCTMEQAAMYQRVPLLHDWAYESRQLYTHPQNLNCKSNQARLATLWGYTKEQPKREPLTDEEIDKINRSTTWPVKSLASLGDRQWAELLRCAARAIEAAHNIK